VTQGNDVCRRDRLLDRLWHEYLNIIFDEQWMAAARVARSGRRPQTLTR